MREHVADGNRRDVPLLQRPAFVRVSSQPYTKNMEVFTMDYTVVEKYPNKRDTGSRG